MDIKNNSAQPVQNRLDDKQWNYGDELDLKRQQVQPIQQNQQYQDWCYIA